MSPFRLKRNHTLVPARSPMEEDQNQATLEWLDRTWQAGKRSQPAPQDEDANAATSGCTTIRTNIPYDCG